tara:strand:+ start:105 stop:836 length:732 start_codon:yes stop_codon:yes gene_type:complete
MWPHFSTNYSPNFSFTKRNKKKIKFIIIHYTGMKKESLAIKKLCSPKSSVSSHYFIKQNGKVLVLVPDLYEAWHAGISSWKNFVSINKNSIGIEIHNSGHNYKYEDFSLKQINCLKKLLKHLIKIYKINPKNILGHSDIAPRRKKDPGEKFPWKTLAKSGLAQWHQLNEKKIKNLRGLKLSLFEKKQFFRNLHKLGYKKIVLKKFNFEGKFLAKAFQRRYRQNLINGKIDKECLAISENLIKF